MKKAANLALILASSLTLSQPLMAGADDHGSSGSSGASSSGTAGSAGTAGASGSSGSSGDDSSSGTSGTSGTTGTSGSSGDDSSSGTSGRSGDDNSSGSSGKSSTHRGTFNSTGELQGIIIKSKHVSKPRAGREELEITAKAKYGDVLTRDNADEVELVASFGSLGSCSFELDDSSRRNTEYKIKLSQRGSKPIKEKMGDCDLNVDLGTLAASPTSITLDDGTKTYTIAEGDL